MGEAKQVIARNKKAFHDYFVLDTYEAGLELFGTEIKSIRQGKVNLKDSWCSIDEGQMYAVGVHISPYDHGNIFNRDPMRRKRLLLHKKEILRLAAASSRGCLSFPCSCILSRAAPNWRSACARVKSSMISGQWLPKRPLSETLTVH